MIDLFLRTANAGALASACPFLRGEDELGEKHWITSGEGWALDVIGPLVTDPGTYDPETGEQLTPPVLDSRFHANLRCTYDIAELVPEHCKIDVATPMRTWL